MDQVAEGVLPDGTFNDINHLAFEKGRRQVEGRLAITTRRALEQFTGRRDRTTERRMRKRLIGLR